MNLNICAIVKDEGLYLEEWIYYHLLQGVDRFYIYHNESTDNTEDILKHFEAEGVLEYKNWPNAFVGSTQLQAYDDHFANHKDSEDWTACMDADEFLYYSPEMTVKEWLNKLPEGITDTYQPRAIVVPWVLYGSNGKEDWEDAPVIKRFTKRATHFDQHVKTILQPKYIRGLANDVHSFKIDGLVMNTQFQPMPDATPTFEAQTHVQITHPILRLNHFHVKSREEYRKRCERGRVDIPVKRDFETNWPIHDINEIEDLGMIEFVNNKLK